MITNHQSSTSHLRTQVFLSFITPLPKKSCGRVMFSRASVCSQGGFNVTIIHAALDLTVTTPRPETRELGTYPQY